MTNTQKRMHTDGTLTKKHFFVRDKKGKIHHMVDMVPQRERKVQWREQFRKAQNVKFRALKRFLTLRKIDASRLGEVQ